MHSLVGVDELRLITFLDGPLEGFVHEVAAGEPVPVVLSERDLADSTRKYHYRVVDSRSGLVGFFDCSESNPSPPTA
jgi:hypothetical protein